MSNLRAICYPYVAMAWRHRWNSIIIAWSICILGWGAIMLIPNKYEVNARLYVDSDAVLTPLLKGIGLESAAASQLDVLHRTLLSGPNIDTLIARTSLKSNVDGPAAAETLSHRLATEVKVVTPTKNLFSVTYSDTNPIQAYEVVNTLLAMFIESRATTSRNENDNARQFLSEQIRIYAEKLKKAEARKNEFQRLYAELLPDAAGGPSQLDIVIAQMASLKSQLADQQLKPIVLRKELENTPSALSTAPDGAGGPSGARVVVSPEMTRAQLDLTALRLRYTDLHPDVVHARERVDRLRASGLGVHAADTASRMIPNPAYERVRKDLVEAEMTIASLERRLAVTTEERARLEAISRDAPNVRNDYVTVKREYDDAYSGYAELLRRREAMRLTEAADSGSDKAKVQVVDPPAVPLNPVSPKRRLLVSAALALGLCAAVGLPLLLKQFDRSFHSLLELEGLDLPIAGGISAIEVPRPRFRRAAELGVLCVAILLLVAANIVLVIRVCEV